MTLHTRYINLHKSRTTQRRRIALWIEI